MSRANMDQLSPVKKHATLGSCGIDCGLCPRYYTQGNSACPGCGGEGFRDKHPSCGVLTCCAVKKGLEACSECLEYPCRRFDGEKTGFDSFVTHRRMFPNLELIKNKGMKKFLAQQNARIAILKCLLTRYDQGHSKNFYCLACALLPLANLRRIHQFANRLSDAAGLKERNQQLEEKIKTEAGALGITLKLNTKRP